jgi:hypothetical protein
MQLAYGAGALYGERIDVTGSGIGSQQFGVLQEVSIDFDFTTKELYGQFQFPVAVARGQGKITGRARFARVLGNLYSDIFFGATPAVGQYGISEIEAAVVPATPSYTVTVAQAASFQDDLGVFFANNNAFKRVTTPSATGEYSVNETTGVYTFAAADAGKAILISYAYNITAVGKKITITNQFQGFTPTFQATFYQPISPGAPGAGGASLPRSLLLKACVASKLSLPSQNDNWEIHELSFSVFADATGTIGIFSTVE